MARLSKRMEAVAALVSAGGTLADIGTDHAYVPIALVKSGKVRHAIAMDIGEGPLARARANIAAAGLEAKIETRLSDGLAKLCPGEAYSILIAGMGGELTMKILSEGEAVCKKASELILQPQSDVPKVRLFLRERGYRIDEEDMVCEDGKYYPMMRVVHGDFGEAEGGDGEAEKLGELYGPILLKKRNPVLRDFLGQEKCELGRILARLEEQPHSELLEKRMQELREQLYYNEKAYIQMGEQYHAGLSTEC